MARLKCTCGNGLSNSDVPSENIINVFREKTINAVLQKTPKISLFDFETSECNEYEYWYCPACQRIHVVEKVPNGMVVKKYKAIDSNVRVPLKNMDVIYMFTATEIYDAEESDFEITLSDFLDQNDGTHMYYLDPVEDKVYKRTENALLQPIYERE